MDIHYCRATSDEDLHDILELQQNNTPSFLSDEEKSKEGFLTVIHTFDLLKLMNTDCPHIIAKVNDEVIGYALCMTRKFGSEIPLLSPMFKMSDIFLAGKKYLAMGQICVAKEFRGQGVFRGLYSFYKRQLQQDFDGLITEVAASNKRSLNAHLSVGFKILQTQVSEGISWELVYWDWN
ncbi:GNAT family N-acetyltransferase [Maribacter algicola]|uniref:GNAT family N-acetyltransferase n=1 Tax=Maribacter algicola TaxID=2498892 RepID=A0A426RMU5_9FLAO|nr:GNAT family N-acetyltransferase [Maribacter algicola]RRQ50304.1 GNAT family N-acetyltransferase [Maribacter algicola]